ncbi:UNVERIFIED_CONTAM: hypothetical protein RMT77_010180 [Armadillidium vulgare]
MNGTYITFLNKILTVFKSFVIIFKLAQNVHLSPYNQPFYMLLFQLLEKQISTQDGFMNFFILRLTYFIYEQESFNKLYSGLRFEFYNCWFSTCTFCNLPCKALVLELF